MSIFKKIGDLVGGKLFKGVTGLVDEIVTSKEEKAQLQIKLQEILNEAQAQVHEFAIESERELTKRHENDMKSDSWLSKNIRPLTLIVIIGLYSVFAITDGNIGKFNIADSYVQLLGQWGMVIMCFYFGGRTIEKASNIIGNKKAS